MLPFLNLVRISDQLRLLYPHDTKFDRALLIGDLLYYAGGSLTTPLLFAMASNTR